MPASKSPSAKKPAKKSPAPAKKAAPKPAAKTAPPKKPAPGASFGGKTSAAPKKPPVQVTPATKADESKAKDSKAKDPKVPPVSPKFLARQRERLLALKDNLLDSMNGVARDSLRHRAEGSEASAFGMHQADAGSDAYDRDFALSLLSQEQDSLYEIDEALKRIDSGNYGICEISGKPIPHPRLEALPFTRYTVECQAELEKRNRFSKIRQPVTSLFGLNDEDSEDSDEETIDTKE